MLRYHGFGLFSLGADVRLMGRRGGIRVERALSARRDPSCCLSRHSLRSAAQRLTRERSYVVRLQGGIYQSISRSARGVFDDIDTDGDGDVSPSEFLAHSKNSVDNTLHTHLAEREQHVFQMHDANKDGFLQFREFVDFMFPPTLAEDDVLTSL